MSLETVNCPFCRFVYRTDVKRVVEDGQAPLVRGPNAKIPKPEKQKLVDLTCPRCGKVFEWPVR